MIAQPEHAVYAALTGPLAIEKRVRKRNSTDDTLETTASASLLTQALKIRFLQGLQYGLVYYKS